ncbi:MAG TPA: hypothetical protein VFF40_03310 [Acidimicrobiia bacterium]|nr:hypothetical protein [Acidimicrobiia bacterium]
MDVTYRCGWCREHGAPEGGAPAVLVARGNRSPIGYRFVRHRGRDGDTLAMEPLGVLAGRWQVRLWCEGCGRALTPRRASALGRIYQRALRSETNEVYVD